MFTFDSVVRFSEVDDKGRLHLASLLNYFQDCSVLQTRDSVGGLMELRNRGYAWVIASWQVIINRYPMLNEKITTGTIPYNFKGFLGSRNFLMTDELGKQIAIANSLWTFMDVKTMKPTRIPDDVGASYPLEDKLDMEYTSRKIRLPNDEEYKHIEDIIVEHHHIDINGHVNNNVYLQIAINVAENEFNISDISSLRVEYRSQAHLGDKIKINENIRVNEADGKTKNICTVSMDDENLNPYCVIEFVK